jgi:hypothetical protein
MTDKDLTKTTGAAMTAPSWIPKDETRRGAEDIAAEDILVPRLAVAQGMTPQVMAGMDGFSPGVLFNTATNELYGKGPVKVAIIKAMRSRYMEFAPMTEGGGLIDPNVPPGDPRTQFRGSEPPIATKFLDFLALMLPIDQDNPMGSLVSVSFKGMNLKKAKRLNMLIGQRGKVATWAGVYSIAPLMEKNEKGTFFVFDIQNAGWVPQDGTYEACEQVYEMLKTTDIKIHEPEANDDAPVDDSMSTNPEEGAPEGAEDFNEAD